MKYRNYRVIEGNEKNIGNWHERIRANSIKEKFTHMNEEQRMEDRLWDYIDGHAAPDEKSAIERLIEEHIAWRKKYKELLELHNLVTNTELEIPSMRFTKNVMEEIAKYHVAPATKSYINKRIIWGIGIFFLVLITGLLIYGFSQVSWSAGTGSAYVDQELNKIPKFDLSRFFSNTYTNIFMMINVVLGLILFDMYLQRKKEKDRQKEA